MVNAPCFVMNTDIHRDLKKKTVKEEVGCLKLENEKDSMRIMKQIEAIRLFNNAGL